MKGQKDLTTMEKGINKIENQGEIWYKMIQNYQMTDFGDKVGHLYVQLSLERLCKHNNSS